MIKKNFLYLLLIQGGNYLFPLLLLPYLGRVLGVEHFGILSYCQALTQYLIILTDYGFNLAATRRISIAREDPQQLARVFWSTTAVRLILTAASLCILTVSVLVVPDLNRYRNILFCFFIGVVGNALFPIWFFQGLEKMGSLMIANVLSKALSFGLVLALVRNDSHTALAAGCIGVGNLLMAGMAYYTVWTQRLVTFFRPQGEDLVDAVKDGFPVFVSTIVGSSYMNFNSILLEYFHGSIAVGQFSMADRIRLAAQSAIFPIVQAFYPRMSQLYASDRCAAKAMFRKAGFVIGSASVAAFIVVQLMGGWAIVTFVGPKFSESIPLLRLEAILLPIIGVALIFGQLGLLAAGRSAVLTKIYIMVGTLHILYAVPLTSRNGATGTILSVILTELLASGLIVWYYFSIFSRHNEEVT